MTPDNSKMDITSTHYIKDGVKYYRVSTILGLLNKPFLVDWAARLAGESGDPEAHKKVLDKTAEQGTEAHGLIEEFLLTGAWGIAKSDEVANCTTAFQQWYSEVSPEIERAEFWVGDKELGVAGTIDLLCKIDGKPYIVDFKTSNAIYPSHVLQLGAYHQLLGEDRGAGILRLPRNGKPTTKKGRLYQFRDTSSRVKGDAEEFVALREYHKITERNKDRRKK